MNLLLAGIVVFFAAHSISIVNDPWRNRQVARLGLGVWKALYALTSIAALVMIVVGYGLARETAMVIYTPPTWLRHFSLLLLIPVFPLALAAYFPGRIKAGVRNPLLVATKAWALAHLLVNGTLADVVLFGSFLIWAVVDSISLKRRTPRPTPSAPPSKMNDVIAVVGGLALYVLFISWLHEFLIGVPPLRS